MILIKIKNEEFKFEKIYKALWVYEELTGKQSSDLISTNTFTSQVIFQYCILKANNENFKYTLDEYLSIIDEERKNDNDVFSILFNYLIQTTIAENKLLEKEEKKKKVK